ncbi:hypothetical protein [Streptomyces deccanensis]|uniref:hypothetical protein n=1 Tax=Streptomyces deccanensis TaxID=424188 RepID=UPI001EFB7C38|nr:hypothetical protein [Streptomyces deccanensis]ULR50367.1 hypothetical protein L3078_14210 [Streptomyces deccanensis]
MTNGKAFDGADGSDGADGPKRPRVAAVALAWVAAHVLGRTPARDRASRPAADGPTRPEHVAQLPRPAEEMFRGHRTAWRERAVAHILYLEQQAAREGCRVVEDPVERCRREKTLEGIARQLREAREAVSARRRLFTGAAALERTWANVRATDVMLLRLCSEQDLIGRSAYVLSHVEQHLRPADPLRVKVAAAVGRVEAEERLPGDRELLVSALSASYEALDGEFSRVRSLSIILRIATFFVLLGAGGLAAWGWACPDSLNMCFLPDRSEYAACPSGEVHRNDEKMVPSDYAQRVDVLVVEAAGLAGAALTVIASLRRIQGTSSPYMLPLAAALLKFPTGALTAFVGVLLIRGAFIPGLSYLDSSPQIVAWAVIFGAAQHLVTRFVDARARETLSDVGRPPTDPPERRAPDGGQSRG